MRQMTRRHLACLVLGVLALSGAAMLAGAARTATRITFDVDSPFFDGPSAMVKLSSPDYAGPTFFVGRGDWGQVSLDLRRLTRHEARAMLVLPHAEINDPPRKADMLGASWFERTDPWKLSVKLDAIRDVVPALTTADPRGTMKLDLVIEGTPAALERTADASYLILENGVGLRTEGRRRGDILIVEATITIPADELRLVKPDGSTPPSDVTLSVWFEAAKL
jgi:hypothetical protein